MSTTGHSLICQVQGFANDSISSQTAEGALKSISHHFFLACNNATTRWPHTHTATQTCNTYYPSDAKLCQRFQTWVAGGHSLTGFLNNFSGIFILLLSCWLMATHIVALLVHSKGRGEPGEGSIVLQVVMHLWKETLQVDDVISSHQDGFEHLSFIMTWTQKLLF